MSSSRVRRAGAKEGCDGADSLGCRSALQQRSDGEINSLVVDCMMAIKLPKKTTKAEHGAAWPISACDPFEVLANEIETLSREKTIKRIAVAQENIEQSYFVLGAMLSKVKANHWFEPHKSLDEFVEYEFGMERRKARYFITIYEKLRDLSLTAEAFSGVGWTKLRALVRVLTEDNVQHWADLARKNSKSELEKLVQAEVARSGNKTPTVSQAAYKKIFKFHDEQIEVIETALEKVKRQAGVESDATALELICGDFCGGVSLVERVKFISDKALKELLLVAVERLGPVTCSQILSEAIANDGGGLKVEAAASEPS